MEIFGYRMRRDRRLAQRGIRLDAEEDNGWRTTDKGKHYQVEPETGEVVKGNIGTENVNEKPKKVSTRAKKASGAKEKPAEASRRKKMERQEIEKRIAEIDEEIEKNDLSHNTGSAYRDESYLEADERLRREKARLEGQLNPAKRSEKAKGEKKFRSTLKEITSEKISDSDFGYKKSQMMRDGFNEEEAAMMQDKSWYKPSKEIKDKITDMARQGASDSEIKAAINRDIYSQVEKKRIERRKKEDEEFQKVARAKMERVKSGVDEYKKAKGEGNGRNTEKALAKMTHAVYDADDMRTAIAEYRNYMGRSPYGWNAVRKIVSRIVKDKVKRNLGMGNGQRLSADLEKDIDDYIAANGQYFMDTYRKSLAA